MSIFKPDTNGIRFGPFWITPGLNRTNVGAIIFASFGTVGMIVFMSLIQPYVLNEMVQVPEARQGQIIGYLTTMQEAIVVLLVGFAGAWSDRVGRRLVFVLGFCLVSAGYLIYPLASSEAELFIYRIVFAFGIVLIPVMLSTTVQDTPQEVSRGKWIGFMNICQGLGVLLLATVLLGRAPQWFASLGYDPLMAGRLSLWSAAGICAVLALVLWVGLPASLGKTNTDKKTSLFRQLGKGIRAGVENPRLAVAFGAAFIGRGDLVIIGNFLTLWIMQSGLDQGLSTAAASGNAFKIFGIVQIAALGWAFFMGLIADRSNRMTAICIALCLSTAGYLMVGQSTDPLAASFIPVALLLGIGEVSIIVTGGALLGQEARHSLRGAIVGVFNLAGGVGIMVVSGLGGVIYDTVGRTVPFTAMGILNGILLLTALIVRFRAGNPESAPQENSAAIESD